MQLIIKLFQQLNCQYINIFANARLGEVRLQGVLRLANVRNKIINLRVANVSVTLDQH
jgi:hypothetical protein